MDDERKIFRGLIAGGVIGASLGALLYEDKGEGGFLGALAGAVILATYKAHQEALEAGVPLLVKEDGKLYKLEGSQKTFIKNLPQPKKKYSKYLKLK